MHSSNASTGVGVCHWLPPSTAAHTSCSRRLSALDQSISCAAALAVVFVLNAEGGSGFVAHHQLQWNDSSRAHVGAHTVAHALQHQLYPTHCPLSLSIPATLCHHRYWHDKGLVCIVTGRLLNLAALGFTIAFSGDGGANVQSLAAGWLLATCVLFSRHLQLLLKGPQQQVQRNAGLC